jgi:DSF synthase
MSMAAEVAKRSEPVQLFKQFSTRFDSEYGVLWGFMRPAGRASFNLQLLDELSAFVRSIADSSGVVSHDATDEPIKYAVIASALPGVFNLGGDLALFREAVAAQDRERLVQYGRKCIDNQYPWYCNFGLPMTTISLVQGDALGGGFECALSSTVLIAEESARMGFPEILFNLFPGMGAYSFLRRKVGPRVAEEIIGGGVIYSARQLYDMGVVDVITPDGTGEAAVYSFIRKHAKSANARRALEAVRNGVDPLTHSELVRVLEIWADTALKLNSRDLKMMERLLRAQRRFETEQNEEASSEANNVVRLEAVGTGD